MNIVAGGVDPAERIRLSPTDQIVCSFGAEYYRGVFWGSSITMVMVLALARRAHLRGAAIVNKIETDRAQSLNRIQRTTEELNKYSPETHEARARFIRDQTSTANRGMWGSIFGNSTAGSSGSKSSGAKKESQWHAAPVQYSIVRMCLGLGLIKFCKAYLSYNRWQEFEDEKHADAIARQILADALQEAEQEEAGAARAAAEPKSVAQQEKELQLIEDAMKVVALSELRRVAALQQTLDVYEERKRVEAEGYVGPQSDLEMRRAAAGSQPKKLFAPTVDRMGLGAAMPCFADGFAVGVWGKMTDADVPSKPVICYLGMKGGM